MSQLLTDSSPSRSQGEYDPTGQGWEVRIRPMVNGRQSELKICNYGSVVRPVQ